MSLSQKTRNLFNGITKSNEGFEKLLNLRGADVNAVNESGNSLLYVAAEKGLVDKINILLSKGANINIKNERGITPLNVVCDRKALGIVQLLIDNGADINTMTNRGNTPLTCMASGKGCSNMKAFAFNSVYDFTEVAELLLDNGADVNLNSPLLIAARVGNLNMVQLLMTRGANINATTPTGETALDIAQSHGHTEIVTFLKEFQTLSTIHVFKNMPMVYGNTGIDTYKDLQEYIAEGKNTKKTKKHRRGKKISKNGKNGKNGKKTINKRKNSRKRV
jgi:ankyrin repeat protein